MADRFFYGSFFLSVSRTECSIKIMMTMLYLHGDLLGSYIYNFFLKDKALLYSPNWPGTGTA